MRQRIAHCEAVLRGFDGFHLEAGTGTMVNPSARSGGDQRARSAELLVAERTGPASYSPLRHDSAPEALNTPTAGLAG
ncbi:hypothetical protein JMUB5695_00691 [Mycobacterium heckeshornense]|uniref:hypothetical protein n=1 Tax=Mycobacterium heckeshornense TaxID=110505 RepID=UPI0019407149|nr:hypothetical protein [Mycobacterium heckeshornense]BCQ07270.1 hypothetical protein JMUB5695_00691 [Mycobacterium heckeshornense]